MMRELRIELEARERCIIEKKAKIDKIHHPVHNSTEALMVAEALICSYCQASHFSDKCDAFTNIETMKALLKSLRCLNCNSFTAPGRVTRFVSSLAFWAIGGTSAHMR